MDDDQRIPAYLSLGSNLGDRRSNLEAALKALAPEVVVKKASSFYETEPWGYADQPYFLNQVLLVETDLSARELLTYLKGLEAELGREPSFRFGPRLVDIDIIFFGSEIVQEDDLEIPHPRFRERPFVLVPLLEISPELSVPGTDEKVSELLADLDSSGVQRCQE